MVKREGGRHDDDWTDGDKGQLVKIVGGKYKGSIANIHKGKAETAKNQWIILHALGNEKANATWVSKDNISYDAIGRNPRTYEEALLQQHQSVDAKIDAALRDLSKFMPPSKTMMEIMWNQWKNIGLVPVATKIVRRMVGTKPHCIEGSYKCNLPFDEHRSPFVFQKERP